MRVGMGYDVHRLTEDRDLILGGVKIDWEKGLLGHSDADVLIHAVMDALLGAAALGDIGKHFPDTDPAYKGISSILLLEHVTKLLREHHYEIGNIDATIIAQKPKMAPHIPQMRANMAKAMTKALDYLHDGKIHTLLSVTSTPFDIFVYEIIVSLTHGQRIVMSNNAEHRNPKLLE